MALSLASISRKAQIRAPRMVLLGTEKIGKTEFACGSSFRDGKRVAQGLNDPIVLPMRGEEGVDALSVPSFPTLGSFSEVMEALGVLYREDHPHRTVVLDSVSALEPLIWQHVCRRAGVAGIEAVGGGYGKGYTEALGCWREITDALDALRAAKNMAAILIGHVRVKRFDDPAGDSYDTYQADLHERAAAHLARWADLTLFAANKVVVKAEDVGFGKEKKTGRDPLGRRFLFTQKRPHHPGGGRGHFGQLPYELPLDYQAFTDAVGEAMTSSSQQETQ